MGIKTLKKIEKYNDVVDKVVDSLFKIDPNLAMGNLILEGKVTINEVLDYFKEKKITKLKLPNGFIANFREDASYIWISGNQNGEEFEIGLLLFWTINKMNGGVI